MMMMFVQRAEIVVTRNSSDEALVIRILEREMIHVADKPDPQDTSEADEILEEGGEVKESLDDLLESLPNIIKKLLKLLNELMKLIRG